MTSGERPSGQWIEGNQWIAQREKKTLELAQQVSLYQAAIEAMDEALLLYDATGHMVQVNSKLEKLLGLTAAQICGLTPHDPSWRVIRSDRSPFPGEERPALTALREGVAQMGVVMGIYDPAGKLNWISVNAVPFGSGDARGVLETAMEIPPPPG